MTVGPVARQQNLVDHMNYAVVTLNIRFDDVGVVDGHLAVADFYVDALTIQRISGSKFRDVRSFYVAGNNVILQNRNQLLSVLRLQKCFDSAGGQPGERVVGWRENRKRTFALERPNKISSRERGC